MARLCRFFYLFLFFVCQLKKRSRRLKGDIKTGGSGVFYEKDSFSLSIKQQITGEKVTYLLKKMMNIENSHKNRV